MTETPKTSQFLAISRKALGSEVETLSSERGDWLIISAAQNARSSEAGRSLLSLVPEGKDQSGVDRRLVSIRVPGIVEDRKFIHALQLPEANLAKAEEGHGGQINRIKNVEELVDAYQSHPAREAEAVAAGRQ